MEIDAHIGCAMSGLTADARTMVDHARVTSQMHNFTYDESIGVESCTQAVCDLALRFGESVEDDDALMVRASVLHLAWLNRYTPSELKLKAVSAVWCRTAHRWYR